MNSFEVIAEPRSELGTSANRRLRRTGRVPGVLYGTAKEPVALSIDANAIKKQLENEAFSSHILIVKVGGEESQAILKAVTVDPTSSRVTHLDFQRVSATSEIHMSVPLHFVNDDTCVGVKAGGVITTLINEVDIGCLPKDLPEYIEVDVSALNIGDIFHLSEINVPEGVTLTALAVNPENDQPVVSVQQPMEFEEEEEGEGEELEAEAAEAGGAEEGAGEREADED